VYPRLAAGGRLAGREHTNYFIDIGVPETFECAQTEVPSRFRRPAVFLDRDGVLNVDKGYVGHAKDWEWIEGAPAAVKRFNDLGWYVFVVTNQSGIGRGLYSEGDFWALHEWMLADLAKARAHVDDIRFCPFHVEAALEGFRRHSDWRKPGPGMIVDLLEQWPVHAEASLLIGDQASDLEAARSAGISSRLFPGGRLDDFVGDELARRSS
jgi:D-glycero-D-manno-heptose 1,7-bisphosphate phosphatase